MVILNHKLVRRVKFYGDVAVSASLLIEREAVDDGVLPFALWVQRRAIKCVLDFPGQQVVAVRRNALAALIRCALHLANSVNSEVSSHHARWSKSHRRIGRFAEGLKACAGGRRLRSNEEESQQWQMWHPAEYIALHALSVLAVSPGTAGADRSRLWGNRP